ncbi:MAG: hypothetical protein OXN25_17905 [Candidatus Poribacteria bacterium]|nr:hypothetical protein [Candidatus Poribacteria bacterium]
MQEHILTAIENLREEIERSRAESRADIERLREETRADIAKLREESHADIAKLREDMTDMKSDISWIKGKLEGRSEVRHLFLTGISIVIAISAVIVAV